MTLEIDLSDAHELMLEQLREKHGEEIDAFLQGRIEGEIHESYQQLRGQS